jgi:hypothetical protein
VTKPLRAADRHQVTDLRADADDARLEAGQRGTGPAVANDMVEEIPDGAEEHLFRRKLRSAPIQVEIDAVLVVERLVRKVVGKTDCRREFVAGAWVEVGVARLRLTPRPRPRLARRVASYSPTGTSPVT